MEESLAGYRALGSEGRSGIAFALIGLANVATEEGDYETSPSMLEEALAIGRSIGNKRGVAEALRNLGWAAMRPGDYTLATQRLHEALPIFKEIGDINGISSII